MISVNPKEIQTLTKFLGFFFLLKLCAVQSFCPQKKHNSKTSVCKPLTSAVTPMPKVSVHSFAQHVTVMSMCEFVIRFVPYYEQLNLRKIFSMGEKKM